MRKIKILPAGLRANRLLIPVICILACTATYYLASFSIEASLIDGEYHPWGYDSFYVATLVREIVDNYPATMQFDDRLHPLHDPAPISFTWAYTLLLATIVVLAQLFNPELPTSSVLAYLPPLWGAINCLVFIAVCYRAGLRSFALAVAAAGFALAPYTRELHLIGNVDHHFMELFFILAIMFGFFGWIERPASAKRAVFAGSVLGLSVAFHFALFVMYLPIALFFLITWIMGRKELLATSPSFLISVLLATLFAVLPSAHFPVLEFEYFKLGWFHLYWAAVFSTALFFMYRRDFTPVALAILVAFLLIAALPVLGSLLHGTSFLAAALPGFEQLNETRSPLAFLFSGDYRLVKMVYEYYTGLIYAIPFVLVFLLWQVRLTPRPELIYALCVFLLGAGFLFLQLRFKYHAAYVMLLPILMLFQQHAAEIRYSKALALVAFVIFYAGPVSNLTMPHSPGGEPGYRSLLPFMDVLATQCAKQPGVLLAHPDEGHYLRYHTDCTILSSNMLASPRDFEYRALAMEMLGMSPPELLQKYEWVDYIYVRLEVGNNENRDAEYLRLFNEGLREELLLDNSIPAGTKSLARAATSDFTYQVLLQTHDRW